MTGLIKTLVDRASDDDRVLMAYVQDRQGEVLTAARAKVLVCVAAYQGLTEQWNWVLRAKVEDRAIRDVLLAVTYSAVYGEDDDFSQLCKAWNEVMTWSAA